MPDVTLLPFHRGRLRLVDPWFTDLDTRRWLGGPRWPRQMLELAGRPVGEFRGARETGRYRWLAWEGDTAVGYIDCGTYDRWTTWEGGPGGRGVIEAMSLPSAGIAFVVDPGLRRRGYGAAMITALTTIPDLAQVELFAAGVEPPNTASIACLHKAGFQPLRAEPDWEGFVYYAWFRAGRHRQRPAQAPT